MHFFATNFLVPNIYGPYRVKYIGECIFGLYMSLTARRSVIVFGIAPNGLENWSA
jgi:hypothetical protein